MLDRHMQGESSKVRAEHLSLHICPYIPLSFFFSTEPKDIGILSRLSPATPLFTTQSTCPFQSEGTCSEMFSLLVNVESPFVTVVVCDRLWWRSGVEMSH